MQRGYKIALVFSDIVMPGSMNGIALAQEIKNRFPHIPVLLTSGYSDVVQTAASRARVLRKPFQLPALEKSIREALDHARRPDTDDRVLPFLPRRHRDAGARASLALFLIDVGLGGRPLPGRGGRRRENFACKSCEA